MADIQIRLDINLLFPVIRIIFVFTSFFYILQ